jgi:poly [ADP-ribose] polymerase 6/8
MIMGYTQRRISTLNNFCVICDKPHVFTSGSMLKPAVCSREICCWGFQQLGVGMNNIEFEYFLIIKE